MIANPFNDRRNPPRPPVICYEVKDPVHPPLWWKIIILSATGWIGSPLHRTVTYNSTIANPLYAPMFTFLVDVPPPDGPDPQTQFNNSTMPVVFTQLKTTSVIQLTCSDGANLIATLLDRPPQTAF